MQPGIGKFARQKDGLPHYAEVVVTVDSATRERSIEFHCTGAGWTGQGYLEDAPTTGYDDWKAGAQVGARFACEIAGVPGARVRIERITGMETDTNPTIVAAAAALAVWNAIGFEPAHSVHALVEAHVFASWKRQQGEIPDLAVPYNKS